MLIILLQALFPMGFIISVGYMCQQKRLLPTESPTVFSRFILNLSLPLLLFCVITKTPTTMNHELKLFLSCTLVFALTYAGVYYWLHCVKKLESEAAIMSALTCTFPDMALMGIPLLLFTLGQPALTAVVIGNIVIMVFFIPLSFSMFTMKKKRNIHPPLGLNTHAISLLTKPIVILPLLGFIISELPWSLPELIYKPLNKLGETTSALSLFTLGAILSATHIKHSSLVWFNVIIKLFVQPLLALNLVILMGWHGDIAKAFIIVCALPSATITSIFSNNFSILTEDTPASVLISTILSFFTIGPVIAILNMLEIS